MRPAPWLAATGLKESVNACVPIDLADSGTELEIESPVGAAAARVVPMPFFDAKKDVPKG